MEKSRLRHRQIPDAVLGQLSQDIQDQINGTADDEVEKEEVEGDERRG
jgi:hypothetical protein